jgi:uncharacterized hydrophobic protein (TIGR00271 family)
MPMKDQKSLHDRPLETSPEVPAHVSHLFSLAVPSDLRTGVFDILFFNLKKGWQLPFWLMLTLSAGLATLGLSENSAAIVIGAMIIAPLGQPIIALGAAVALGWPRQFIRLLMLAVIGAASVVTLAFGIGLLLPTATPNDEILARTAPDLRDLCVALFAGIAGAYGYYRFESSAVLAGVAIAVALIPPLCTAGLMLAEGRYILATGAYVLFLTNFIGIAIAAVLVFFLTGVAHAESRRGWFVGGAVITVAAAMLVIGPLAANYKRLGFRVIETRQAYQTAEQLLKTASGSPVIVDLSIDRALLTITLRGSPNDPTELRRLTDAIQKALGLQVELVAETK